MVKNPPAMRETQVHSLGRADLLEKGMATHSNILPGGSFPGSGRSPREGNGNPLQYSSWRIPMDRGAWQTKYSCDLVIGRILYLILDLFSCT